MARMVSVPAATAALLLADRTIDASGVITPTERGVYGPLLEALHHEGIAASRHVVQVSPNAR